MLDIAAFQAAAASLKVASDITKSILSLRDEAKIHAKVMELNAAIMDAQNSALSAQLSSLAQVGRIRELEERLVQMENWEREKQRYELHEVSPGVLTYTLKEAMSAGEPAHQLCARCYQDGKKSILQHEHLAVGRTEVLICDRCDSELITAGLRQAEQPSKSKRR
jgi:superfamily II helicase